MSPFVLILIILGAVLGWAAMWVGVVALLGLGGWRTLAALYPAGAWPERSESVTMTGQNLLLGPVRYKGAIHAALTEGGLYLRPTRIFAVNHPTVFIPWTAAGPVQHDERNVYLDLEGAPRLMLNGTAAPLIAQEALAAQGGRLPLEDDAPTDASETPLRDLIRAKSRTR